VFYGISALDRNTNVMIDVLILGVMGCFYGSQLSFKSKPKNVQELLLTFNLLALFVVSLYTTLNSIAVNILVAIAIRQFVILSLYKKKLFWNDKVASHFNRLLSHSKLAKCFNFGQPRSFQAPQKIQLHNNVPEVVYNYKEFREPLIELDK